MRLSKILFIVSIAGITTLFLISSFNQKIFDGKVDSIKEYEERKIVTLIGEQLELILFSRENLNLGVGDFIQFTGRKEIHKGKEEILVDKIIKR